MGKNIMYFSDSHFILDNNDYYDFKRQHPPTSRDHRPALYWAGGLNLPDGLAWGKRLRQNPPRYDHAHLWLEY